MKIQEFDFSVELLQALLWQYNSATRLQQLLDQKNSWYFTNQQTFWQDWYNNVFNLLTANTFGLAVWSIILNIPLFIELNDDPPGKPLFGFNEVTVFPSYINSYLNFENSNFSNRDSSIILTIEEQRLILRLRYYQLVSRGATPDTNKFLSVLFKDFTKTYPAYGIAYVLDGLDMTMTYIFNFNISQNLRYILSYYDILPRPAGVKVKYIILTGTIFGFNEVTVFPEYININNNFENGNFIAEFLGG